MYQQNVTMGPGTGNFTSHTLEILIMLLGAFLLGLWLGWVLWNKYKQEVDKLRLDNAGLVSGMDNLSAELNALKGRFTTLDNERSDLATRLQIMENENNDLRRQLSDLTQNLSVVTSENRQLKTELSLNTGESTAIAALATLGEPDDSDDSSTRTAELNTDEVEQVIMPDKKPEMTLGFEMATPTSNVTIEKPGTPDPTEIAVTDDSPDFTPVMEDHLEDFKASTESSSRMPQIPNVEDHFSDEALESFTRNSLTPPPADGGMDTPPAITVLTPLQQDDLKIVEGIGPKIEQLLFNAGIHTYSELAAAPVSRLKEILTEAGPRYAMHDPGTWSAQALLAANEEWENLKAYQEFLDAGKRPTG